METDSLIQASLRTEFEGTTILTIAHRLNTIMDYTRVMVLSYGRIKEFASPAELLRDPDSIFTSMVNETGTENSALLKQIAFNAEQQRQEGRSHVTAYLQSPIHVPHDNTLDPPLLVRRITEEDERKASLGRNNRTTS